MADERRIEAVGLGWDLHRLAGGRRLMLCGVEVPFEKGLLGHSDGDAALHAVIDALLGAAGLGDIGELFPPDDPTWAGADSGRLLQRALEAVSGSGFSVVHVDVTIIAEQPRLGPHKLRMRQRLAELLAVPLGAVNIKAKTGEGLDAVGRGEAISALAIAGLAKIQAS